ncbi:rhomboid family intramembrane serine protease [Oceanibacterium hippocampi]|uniref:Intramembrane serine protease GlpG n=1 Tax=Oceanibacterium hippocampi TaxID=745714 RepID=A0A1Y5R6Q7_9PROT|nr:rhomboid family intramembrane serine protease [Oceanibacterium hippocampi]SLN10472.1 intramembrane serine protease GlpG [Oceanibacterium hippocampi]
MTMSSPRPKGPPIFNVPPATRIIALILVAVFAAVNLLPAAAGERIVVTFGFVPAELDAFLGGAPGLVPDLAMTMIGHMFLHHDLMHLIMNCGLFLAFGSLLERLIGSLRLTLLFLVCGVAGAVAQTVLSSELDVLVYGASGGVFGLMGAAAWLMAARAGPARAMIFVAVILALNFVIGLTPVGTMLTGGGAGVAWQAHLGGFFAGGLLYPLMLRRRRGVSG